MTKFIALSLACLLLTNCQSSYKNRTPQETSVEEASTRSSEEKFETTFQTLLNHETSEEISKNFSKYIQRQMGIFFIAQGYVNSFDIELEKLYTEKLQNPNQEFSSLRLENIQLKLNFIFEFYKTNLHEMTYIYQRVVETANSTPSKEQQAATYILSSLKSIFENAYKFTGDQMAIISIAQEFAEINAELKEVNPEVKTPTFLKNYLNKTDSELKVARIQSLKFQNNRKKRYIDSFLEKEWQTYLSSKLAEQDKQNRQPQSDELSPSAGPQGNITGNNFKQNYWAITFDDGPHPKYTQGMLDAMAIGNYKGTFFWLAQNITRYPDLVKKVGDLGFKRASHSYTHPNLAQSGPKKLDYEINQASLDFKKVIGQEPTFFRCPYGSCADNRAARQMIAARNMMHVKWNVDSLDWQDKNPESVFLRTKKQMLVLNRGVVLFHDIHPQSVAATKLLVEWIKKEKPEWKLLDMSAMFKEVTGKDFPSP